MNSKQTLENLGLKVIDDKPYDFSAIAGKKCYGQLWEKPEFLTLEQFARTVDAAPVAHRIIPDQKGIDFRGRSHIVVDGQYVTTVTPKFHLYQHKEILMNAVEAAKQIGLRPVGQVRHKAGRMDGHVVFTGAEEQVQLLKDTGENLAVGAKFFSSYAGDRGLGFQAFAINAICCNYNAWGKDIGQGVSTTHANATAMEEIEAGFRAMIATAGTLPAVINAAKESPIARDTLVDLLWGVRFPESAIMGGKRIKNALVPNLAKWEPKTEDSLNRWTVYQAGTAFLTHGSGMNSGAVEYHTEKIAQILNGDLDDLIADGRDRREAAEQRQSEETEESQD